MGQKGVEMAAEERQEPSLLPPFVESMLSTLPTPNFALQGWGFVEQDGACRPGVEMYILMEPPSGGSIGIKVAFWGNGSPRKAIYTSLTSTTEVRLVYPESDPWEFIRRLREAAVALRR